MKVHFDGDAGRYVEARATPEGVVQRPIGPGELVPRAAVGSAASVSVRAVSVTLDKGQADVVRAGGEVEVWVADKSEGAGTPHYEKPRRVIDSALVSRIGGRSGGVVAVADGQPVELLVPRDQLAGVIDAVNSGARITLVPLASGAGS